MPSGPDRRRGPVSGERPSEKTTQPLNLLTKTAGAAPITLADLSGQIGAFSAQVDGFGTQLGTFQQTVESRFTVFHSELSLLRTQVTGDIAPRVTAVEAQARTSLQKVSSAALFTGKYAGLFAAAGLVLRACAKQWPQFGGAIEGVLGALGL